ncbi:glycosyl transferase group 1 [Cupriavidus necator N-1]|uniref:Glycosyl transferase group 1 n=1 Tax=Cupriavidus necator (strain ATCC 43291 / DSM 13513 / CCUG 52238 / LMG 8453 / N-1) TaxID=1042878 RepID=G0ETV7_CUPNN|nr:glycosyltransferase family 4 protein [Cupriavidus necator]AEI78156.1 glycosyl transferase group 1 [Cupriavidus necator N-1]MDX6013318.1 glycosyltransferase family 4 protein [Cupriavidus necator]
MNGLKFLLTTYSTAFATSGGGESEMVQVAEILNTSGIHADIYGIGSRPFSFYDGIMHFSVHADGDAMIREARHRNKPIFLWPNVWWNEPPSQSEVDRIEGIIGVVHKLLFKSESELLNFSRYVNLPDGKAEVVPACVSRRFLAPVDKDLASAVCGASDYALCLGLIEPVKNQLQLIRALNMLGMDGVFVGGARDDEYYRQCVEEAHGRIVFLPFVQPCSALLRSIIDNCSVMVEVSSDPPGRSSLEAAIMKKPMIMADGPWQREHFGDDVWYAPPDSAEALATTIRGSLADADWERKIQATYERTMSRHSAEVIGRQLAELLENEDT